MYFQIAYNQFLTVFPNPPKKNMAIAWYANSLLWLIRKEKKIYKNRSF